ncbi:MAG: hypothetical protein M3032_07135 [Verrucomicrobiota bacterium]|nr:hypothetical protein [Verrucomicrobiota bacterium]
MALANVPVDFVLFGLLLVGVAIFHERTLRVALLGLGAILLHKVAFPDTGLAALVSHFGHDWVVLVNLLCLLIGFPFSRITSNAVTSPRISRSFSGAIGARLRPLRDRPDTLPLHR